MASVLVVGIAVIDFVFQVDEMPTEPIKYRARDAEIIGGGCAANAAVAIQRLGGRAHLVARMGKDVVGDLIVSDLMAEGVDCNFIKQIDGKRSSFSSVYVDRNGERQLVNFRDTTLPSVLDWVSSNDLLVGSVLADTRWPDGAKRAMEIAGELGVPGILDAEDQPADASEALALASHVAFSSNGLKTWSDSNLSDYNVDQALADFRSRHNNWVCVTEGEAGCRYIDSDGIRILPGYAVPAVDTLGAGDIWHGAFALEMASGGNEKQAMQTANAAAAIKCTQFGGRKGAPTQTQLTQFLKENI